MGKKLQPKIRYTDTSYIIFQQWQKGGGKATFPVVYNFVPHPKSPANEIENHKSSKSIDNAISPNGSIASKQNGDIVQKQNGSVVQKAESNGKKLKKRRSRSLDRKRNKRSLIIDDSDESLYDGDDDVDETDNVRCSSVPITSNVTVDVHRPSSTVIQLNVAGVQDDDNGTKSSTVVPESNKFDTTTLDINHNALPLAELENVDSSKDVANRVQIRRKKMNPISDSSSFDESSDQEVGYATVRRESLTEEILAVYKI
ncbi:hypothetical protein Bhyg_12873 [Pseudolycoriella hygida]|uniref:Uncharacterized protein n=1 Tax=Pseudolycoriella hygida TaxID=35572 RepID=A0A9Q0MZ37_9DIPT|nr:hypothetical protein Bhyg_12873 [Pseudolycoriella hygida]